MKACRKSMVMSSQLKSAADSSHTLGAYLQAAVAWELILAHPWLFFVRQRVLTPRLAPTGPCSRGAEP